MLSGEPESLGLLPGLDAGQRGGALPRAVRRARGPDREMWTRLTEQNLSFSTFGFFRAVAAQQYDKHDA